jgi:hypothetical protein
MLGTPAPSALPIPRSWLVSASLPSASRIDPAALTKAAQDLGHCTSAHVLDHLDLPVTKANEMVVGKHLRGLGYTRARLMVRGIRGWVFFPPQDAAS